MGPLGSSLCETHCGVASLTLKLDGITPFSLLLAAGKDGIQRQEGAEFFSSTNTLS